MEKHLTNLLSTEDIMNFRSQVKFIKESSLVLQWDESAMEPYPTITNTHKIINNINLGKIEFDLETPSHVKDMIIKIANEQGLNVRFLGAEFVEYAPEHGIPRLTNHKDEYNVFMVDYQLYSNTSWPLIVDGKTYDLKDNEALAFCTKIMMHGRTEKKFNPGEYVGMIFFHTEILGKIGE